MAVTVHAAARAAAAGRCHTAVAGRVERVLACTVRLAPGRIAAEQARGRPIGHGGRQRVVVMLGKLAFAIDHAAADHREVRAQERNLVLGHLEEVLARHDEVGELAYRNPAPLTFLVAEPGHVFRPHAQGRLAIQQIALRVHLRAAHGLAGDHPRQRHPGVVGGDARGVGAGRDLDAFFQNALDGWRGLGRTGAVALDEVLALVGHAVLHGNAAAQRRDAVYGLVGDGLGMVEEPVDSRQRRVAVDLLEHIESTRYGFVIGRMQAPGPLVLHQHAHHFFKLTLHLRRHVRALHAKVLEVGGRIHQHLTRAVVAEVIVALLVLDRSGPVQKVLLLLLGLLREQVVGQAHGDLVGVGQLLDHLVVFGIVLIAPARIDHAGHAQAVELAHEMACRVDLVVQRQLGALGQGRIEDGGIGLGQQQTGRVAARITHDLAARRCLRVLGIAHGTQRSTIEQCSVVQMQQKHRRIGCNRIDLCQRGQALLDELVLGKAPHHAHPLRRRGNGYLALEHVQRIGQRAHPVPAQLHVVIQAAAHHMGVVVEQAGQHAFALEVDAPGPVARQRQDFLVVTDGDKAAGLDGHGTGHGFAAVQRGDLAVEKNGVGMGIGHGRCSLVIGCGGVVPQ